MAHGISKMVTKLEETMIRLLYHSKETSLEHNLYGHNNDLSYVINFISIHVFVYDIQTK